MTQGILNDEIEDLRLFTDPFEAFTAAPHGESWRAVFVRRGREIAVQREPDGTVRTLRGSGQRCYRNLRGLLVSEHFAHLERLAHVQTRGTARLAETAVSRGFLPNAGEIRCGDDSTALTFDSVCERLEQPHEELRIFVVNGAAGVGKSHLIERMVRRRAAPASYRSGKPLLLHVESRGKVLTALGDRIAGTLSSLRASFVEDELKPLVRRGAVQVAIDGFDELSDSRGYARAWGALKDFIRDLRGRGTCVLAGRDTMLDLDTVREGLGNTVDPATVTFLHLRNPPVGAVRDWLSREAEWSDRAEALGTMERAMEENEYLRRPFVVSQIADLGPDRCEEAQGEPIAELMETIARREGAKLTGASADIDSGLAAELYLRVLAETARIMMDDETNTVEVEIVGLIVEETFTAHANREMVDALAQRAGALALLEEDAREPRRRAFPHETVRSYFFARSVCDDFPEHGAPAGMHRVPLSADDFRIFNRVARRRTVAEQTRLRTGLRTALRGANGYDCLRPNVGGLLLSFAPLEDDVPGDDELVLANLQLNDVWIADLLGAQQVTLVDCAVHRLDVRAADLGGVRFMNVEVSEMLADPFVRFGASVPTVHSLIVHEHGRARRWAGSPSAWIERRSGAAFRPDSPGSAPDEKWHLLERFARISMRQYAIRSGKDNADPAAKRILDSPWWPPLRSLLEDHGRLEVQDNAAAAGPKSQWFHLVAGAEFLNPHSAKLDSTRTILAALNVGARG